MAAKKRDYKRESAKFASSPEARAAHVKRVQARRIMKKALGAAAIKGKDIDHKIKLRNGGSNARSNLRVRSIKANRGDNR